jgi:hypothetical protein
VPNGGVPNQGDGEPLDNISDGELEVSNDAINDAVNHLATPHQHVDAHSVVQNGWQLACLPGQHQTHTHITQHCCCGTVAGS